MFLGCIGDDFTGSSDLANTLVKGGMATTLYCRVPEGSADASVEAGVVALKTRSIPVKDAVAQSLAALRWLKAQGCRQFFFKYCSTFDSTKDGNIGPVAEALLEAIGADQAIVCPAFPSVGRTLYQGHLFVSDRLLSESGMEAHPLTPMTDPDIRRWLREQTDLAVGHVALPRVLGGEAEVENALADQRSLGRKLIVVDAVTDTDLRTIGKAVKSHLLITGGSGVALGLPDNFRALGLIGDKAISWKPARGHGLILSGSCSNATRGQVAHYKTNHPSLEIDAEALMGGEMTLDKASDWLKDHLGENPLVYSSADPDRVAEVQSRFGTAAVSAKIEDFFRELVKRVIGLGYQNLVSAGGETSGAIVQGLGCDALEVGPEIDPGVPMLRMTGQPIALALKSGNFGSEDFFAKALAMLGGTR